MFVHIKPLYILKELINASLLVMFPLISDNVLGQPQKNSVLLKP
jgi:hypothetical protein